MNTTVDPSTCTMFEQMTWWRAVDGWMTRVANAADRPLPLLVVSGATGTGKSVGITEAARRRGIRVVAVGSDTTQSDDPTKGAFSGQDALKRWRHAVATRSLVPQVLMIDDADAMLGAGEAKGPKRARGNVRVEDVVGLGTGQTPVVVVATDMWATPVLRELQQKKRSKLLTHIRTKALPAVDMQCLLAAEFPREPVERIRQVVASGRLGDVRAARLELAYGTSGDTRLTHSDTVRTADSVFDQVHAAFGMAGRLPPTVDAADAVMQSHAHQARQLVSNHYIAVCPDDKGAVVACVADALSFADTLAHGSPDVSNHLVLRRVPETVRLARLQQQTCVGPDRLNFTGPMIGQAARHAQDALRTLPVLAAYVDRLDLLTLEQHGRLVACTRTDRKTPATGHRTESGAAQLAWSRRPDLAMLIQKHGIGEEERRDPLYSVENMTTAVQRELQHLQNGTMPPWQLRKRPHLVDGKPRPEKRKRRKRDQ